MYDQGDRKIVLADALGEKTVVRVNVWHACQDCLLVDWKSTEVKLRMEDWEEVVIANFQVKSF